MWLHLEEDECLSRGSYAKQPSERNPIPLLTLAASLPELDEPLQDSIAVEPEPEPISSPSAPTEPAPAPATSSVPTASLFSSLAQEDSSDSEHETDLNSNKENEKWALLMLQLDNLRIAAGQSKRGKKGKSNGVLLETSEIRGLKDKIGRLEKEYMFSRKDAGKPWQKVSSDSQTRSSNLSRHKETPTLWNRG